MPAEKPAEPDSSPEGRIVDDRPHHQNRRLPPSLRMTRTPFIEAKYTVDHMELPENIRKNIWHQYDEAGHIMYLHDEDLAKLKKNVAAFIDTASKQ
jgi:hypothetical protein